MDGGICLKVLNVVVWLMGLDELLRVKELFVGVKDVLRRSVKMEIDFLVNKFLWCYLLNGGFLFFLLFFLDDYDYVYYFFDYEYF